MNLELLTSTEMSSGTMGMTVPCSDTLSDVPPAHSLLYVYAIVDLLTRTNAFMAWQHPT